MNGWTYGKKLERLEEKRDRKRLFIYKVYNDNDNELEIKIRREEILNDDEVWNEIRIKFGRLYDIVDGFNSIYIYSLR